MTTAEMSNSTVGSASKKVETLIAIGAGKLMENTLNKLIRYQISKYRNYMAGLIPQLSKFEKQYHMPSEEFYQKFESGELGDEADYFEWSSLYENALLYKRRLEEMESLDITS